MFRLLRRNDGCRGGEDGASGCPATSRVRCSACGQIREEDEIEMPGACACGCPTCEIERCDDCPAVMVQHMRAHSPAGRLLERVLDHEFDTKHYKVPIEGVDAELRDGLKILEEERARFESDERKRMHEEVEQQRIEAEMASRQRARAEGRS